MGYFVLTALRCLRVVLSRAVVFRSTLQPFSPRDAAAGCAAGLPCRIAS